MNRRNPLPAAVLGLAAMWLSACSPNPAGTSPDGGTDGGTASGLSFHLKTVPVAGHLTLNGAGAPAGHTNCTWATLTFGRVGVPPPRGFTPRVFTATLPCEDTDGAFAIRLEPGTYAVVARFADGAAGRVVLASNLDATSALSDVTWDVKTVPISGHLTFDGAPPTTPLSCDAQTVELTFIGATGNDTQVKVPCNTADGAFSTALPPDTYTVETQTHGVGPGSLEGLFPLASNLQISTGRSNLDLDLKTIAVSGHFTVDGVAPTDPGATGNGPQVGIELEGRSTDPNARIPRAHGFVSASATDGAFSLRLPVGSYTVIAQQLDAGSTFSGSLPLASPVDIAAARSNLDLDLQTVAVSGHFTVDGVAPTAASSCVAPVQLTFFDTTDTSTFAFASIPCGSTDGAFTAQLPPGTYHVQAAPVAELWPNNVSVAPRLAVAGPMSNLDWDLKTARVSGHLLLDGKPPVDTASTCQGGQVSVGFAGSDGQVVGDDIFRATIPCDATDGAFSIRLPLDTYGVTARATDWDSSLPHGGNRSPSTGSSSAPTDRFLVDSGLKVASQGATPTWDLKTVRVFGHVTVDGEPPVDGAGACVDGQVGLWFSDSPGTGHTAYVPCGATDGAFDARVPAGTYSVGISRYDPGSTFPDLLFDAATGLKIP